MSVISFPPSRIQFLAHTQLFQSIALSEVSVHQAGSRYWNGIPRPLLESFSEKAQLHADMKKIPCSDWDTSLHLEFLLERFVGGVSAVIACDGVPSSELSPIEFFENRKRLSLLRGVIFGLRLLAQDDKSVFDFIFEKQNFNQEVREYYPRLMQKLSEVSFPQYSQDFLYHTSSLPLPHTGLKEVHPLWSGISKKAESYFMDKAPVLFSNPLQEWTMEQHSQFFLERLMTSVNVMISRYESGEGVPLAIVRSGMGALHGLRLVMLEELGKEEVCFFNLSMEFMKSPAFKRYYRPVISTLQKVVEH